MPVSSRLLSAAACFLATGCGFGLPKLPPLLIDAASTGGSNFLCEGGDQEGALPDTASHSPEIVRRLRAGHPPGSSAADLSKDLLGQGFIIHEGCSADRSVSWAEYRQQASNGFGYYTPGFGTVYWKQDKLGRLVWATGDIAYTGL
jgi:hypothetical protein